MLFGPRKALTQKAKKKKKTFLMGVLLQLRRGTKEWELAAVREKQREFSQRRRSVSTFRPSASLLKHFSPPSLRHHHTELLYSDGLRRLMQNDAFLLVQVVGLLFSSSILLTNTRYRLSRCRVEPSLFAYNSFRTLEFNLAEADNEIN